jgi:predicted regulator of Ras-like GTPase activity (Roadblock/LC7/MglB family)
MEPQAHQQLALQQLATVPGVVGSLVFGAGGEITAAQFPPVFERAGLDRLTQQLAADGYLQEWLADEEGALDLRYAEALVLVRAVNAARLLVLCTSQVNPQLVAMSLTQVVRKLRAAPAPSPAPPPLPEAPAVAAPPPAAAPPSTADRLRAVVRVELGPHAPQALELLAAAGDKPRDLRRAADDIEKLTKLFISTKKAGEIARKMNEILGG